MSAMIAPATAVRTSASRTPAVIGAPPRRVASAETYAPKPKKPTRPRLIMPAMPHTRFNPSASSAYRQANVAIATR